MDGIRKLNLDKYLISPFFDPEYGNSSILLPLLVNSLLFTLSFLHVILFYLYFFTLGHLLPFLPSFRLHPPPPPRPGPWRYFYLTIISFLLNYYTSFSSHLKFYLHLLSFVLSSSFLPPPRTRSMALLLSKIISEWRNHAITESVLRVRYNR